MSDSRFERVGEIFRDASDLEGDARAEFVREAAAGDEALRIEVERMLAASDVPDELLDAGPGVALAEEYKTGEGLVGQTIGSYRVLRHIASGGMGAVYEAEQDHPRRRVAVKVLNTTFAGVELRRRFEREVEILGGLHHPGVAQILEAGSYSGDGATELPFIAMELITGQTIVEHARERGLAARECVELVARVCEAIEYAHQRGIVHRDLKPANILVDESGQPKVLDFGVAHMAGSSVDLATLVTEPGVLLGTIGYMSPEQARGDVKAVDARADVHALGVLLFELLSGRIPYEVRGCPIPEAVRLLTEDEPTTLSSIDPTLHSDLNTIVQKAIEKEPERRYASAAELAADLERHLRHEPILAQRPSRVYRMRKFTRRHRTLVVAASLIAVSLVAGTTVSLLMTVRAQRQTKVANQALTEAQRGMEELHEMLTIWRASATFGAEFPQQPKLKKLELEIIERSAPGFQLAWQRIEGKKSITRQGFEEQERQRSELLIGLGAGLSPAAKGCVASLLQGSAWNKMIYDPATGGSLPLLRRADELLADDARPTDPRVLVLRALLLDGLFHGEHYEEAERLVTTWLRELEAAGYGDEAPQVALYQSRKGALFVELERYKEAEPLLHSSVELVESTWGSALAFEVKAAKVDLHEKLGDVTAARDLRGELMQDVLLGRANGPHHTRVALGSSLKELWTALESFEFACGLAGEDVAKAFQKVREQQAALGVSDGSPAGGIVALYLRLGAAWHGNTHGWATELTLTLCQDAIRRLRIAPMLPKRQLATGLLCLGIAHQKRGEYELSLESAREGLEVWFGNEDYIVWELRTCLGIALGKLQKFKEAHAHIMASYRGLTERVGPTDPTTFTALFGLIQLHLDWADGDGAAERRAEVEGVLSKGALKRWRSEMTEAGLRISETSP